MPNFLDLGMTSKRIKESAKKQLFKLSELCYSINEANRMLNGHFARPASAGANGRNMPANESFNIWWRYITKIELSANMYGDSEVCFIGIFCIGFLDDYVRSNQLSKVVHDQSGKDLLVYVLHLFCVEMEKAYGILEFPERGFNPPTHIIKFLQFGGREILSIQVCNHSFV